MEIKLAERLKYLRISEGMTQTALASTLGIKQSNISDWENGVSRPEYENLVKLANIFGVTCDYLLGAE